jgi:hypothetical protein
MFLYYFQKVSAVNYFSPKVQQNNKNVFKLFFLKNFQPSPIFEQNNKKYINFFFLSFNRQLFLNKKKENFQPSTIFKQNTKNISIYFFLKVLT